MTTPDAWAEAQAAGCYRQPAGGFLHLCTEAQLAFVLEEHFAGRTDLIVLRMDAAGLDVRWEESEPGMAPFPHLYGNLPTGAVRSINVTAKNEAVQDRTDTAGSPGVLRSSH